MTIEDIARRYRNFATFEAKGRSLQYETLANAIAESETVLTFLEALPAEKQQPNLLLAAARMIQGAPVDIDELESLIKRQADDLQTVMRLRATQTNEPGRCAVLLPLLAQIDGPVALIEGGASAGLCLYPDLYGYDYGGQLIGLQTGPIFPCNASPNTPLPAKLPDVVWRSGLDLNPLDITSDDDMTWLELLIWPGMEDRAERLRAAVKTARSDPPKLIKGDLTTDLQGLINQAPAEATKVVFHTAVLGYIPNDDDRADFAAMMLAADAVWISNEHPLLFEQSRHLASDETNRDKFALMLNGQPVARTDPHGKSIEWIA